MLNYPLLQLFVTNLLLKSIITDLKEKSKTNCLQWHTDGWGGYERVFRSEIRQIIGKDQTQQLETGLISIAL